MSKLARWLCCVLILAGLAAGPGPVAARGERRALGSTPPSVVDGFDPHADNNVAAILVQPDQKILVGGQFGSLAGQTHHGLARLNPDGSAESAFTAAIDYDPLHYGVNAFALQAGGKILVAGQFDHLNDVLHPNLGRLNPDGSLDGSFNPAIDGPVEALAVQPDGKIVIAGQFQKVNAQIHPYIARLNADGSTDDSFLTIGKDLIYALLLQPDGKIVLAGKFAGVNTDSRKFLARLNPDGSTDGGFAPNITGSAFSDYAACLALQPDGMILVGGTFTNRLLRYKPDGSLDSNFLPVLDASVRSLAVLPDGGVLASGAFSQVNGSPHYHLARFNHGGTLDATFGATLDYRAFAIATQADGAILLGGDFFNVNVTNFSLANRYHLARLLPNGDLDETLKTSLDQKAAALARQPDGRLLLGGAFTAVNTSFAHLGLARLDASGALDASYTPSVTGAGASVLALAAQADGKALVMGDFTQVNSLSHTRLARLYATGSLDGTYSSSAAASQLVAAGLLQPDGQLVIGGLFVTVNGQAHSHLARLAANGVPDAAFQGSAAGVSLFTSVNTLGLQLDGKILVGGNFTTLDGVARPNLGRLNSDGSLDSAFAPAVDGSVTALAVQPDGKILIAGGFANVNSQPRARLARLNADGSLDLGFNPGAGGFIYSLALQNDGAILVGGSFNDIAGQVHPFLARLTAAGALDATFAVVPTGSVSALLLTPEGKLLFSGDFTSVDGLPRAHLARVTLGGSAGAAFHYDAARKTLTWTPSGPAPAPAWVVFEQSADGLSYTGLGSAAPAAGSWSRSGVTLTTGAPLFLRARAAYPGGYGNGSTSQLVDTHYALIPPSTGGLNFVPLIQR